MDFLFRCVLEAARWHRGLVQFRVHCPFLILTSRSAQQRRASHSRICVVCLCSSGWSVAKWCEEGLSGEKARRSATRPLDFFYSEVLVCWMSLFFFPVSFGFFFPLCPFVVSRFVLAVDFLSSCAFVRRAFCGRGTRISELASFLLVSCRLTFLLEVLACT
jgi:hypothetical protein